MVLSVLTEPVESLPAPLTPLVGRRRELALAIDFLRPADCGVRLVTLTGPGGVGKTRLALQIAHELASGGADVVFVPLASLADPALVLPAIAQAFGIRERPDQALAATIASALRGRRPLLLLDNFEHLVAAAPTVTELLSRSPDLSALVTSRAPLRLSGEQELPVAPLPIPDRPRAGRVSLDELAQVDSVALFLARTRGHKPDFALTAGNAEAVAAICATLEGLPLAIELAAARTKVLSPAALLARLTSRLTVLTDGPRDLPTRLQTMRAAIAWSYDLLSPGEQALFRRLCIFEGGFTLEAAEHVGAEAEGREGEGETVDPALPPSRLPASAVLDGIASLVDKSLLHLSSQQSGAPSGHSTRYSMLETIREFGIEQARMLDEETDERDAHAAYYLILAERLNPELGGPAPWPILDHLRDEVANVRAALTWFAGRGLVEAALRLAIAVGWSWSDVISRREGRDWLERLLALPGADITSVIRAEGLYELVQHANWLDDYGQSRPWLEEALAIFRTQNNQLRILATIRSLGQVECGLGEYDEAKRLLLQAEELAREAGERGNQGAALHLLGWLAQEQADWERAVEYHRQARDVWRSGSHEPNAMEAVMSVALTALERGDLVAARAAGLEALAFGRARHDLNLIARSLMVSGGVATARGQMREAVRLFARARALDEERGSHRWPNNWTRYEQRLDRARSALGEPAYTQARAAGTALSLSEAMDEAHAVLSGAEIPDRASDAQPATLAGLTRREQEVLRLLVEGRSDREIAAALSVSPRTVTTHVQHILAKLDVTSRTAAAATAVRLGLV